MRGRDQAAAILIALTLTTALFALGGAQRWAACATAGLAVVSALPYLTSRRTASRLSPLLVLLFIAIALTAMQVVPLPGGVIESLAPQLHELVADNAAAMARPSPAFLPLSYDPPATLVELAKLVGYAAFAFACLRFASSREGRRLLPAFVGGLGAAMALTALGHHALGAHALFGVFRPSGFDPDYLAPLINENHLAGFLAMTVPVSLGLAVQSAGARRGAWLGAALVSTTTCLLTGSRGGAIGLVVGLLVAAVLYVLQRRSGDRDHSRRVPLVVMIPSAVVTLCVIVLVGALAAGDVANELATTSAAELDHPRSKFRVWSGATTLLADNRWTGVGRGAFEPSYTRINEAPEVTFSHVENEYLQAAVDWGVPGAAALALALVLMMLAAARRWKAGPAEAGALAALLSLAIHDVADFALEVPGVAMTAVALLALLLPPRLASAPGAGSSGSTSRIGAAPRRALARRATALAAAAIVVALAASPLARSSRNDEAAVLALADSGAPPDAVADRAQAAFTRHPADYVLAARTAQALLAAGNPQAVKLVSRALVLNPASSPSHHLAARILERSQRPTQALVEYALALASARDVRPLLDDLIAAFPSATEAARGLPLEPLAAARVLRYLDTPARKPIALAHAQRVAEAAPSRAAAQSLLAREALAQRRFDLAAPAARRAHQLAPTTTTAIQLARALAGPGASAGPGQAADGARIIEERLGQRGATATERGQLLFTLAELRTALGELEGARTAYTDALPFFPDDRVARSSIHLRLAAIEDRLGNANQAAWERREAEALAPPRAAAPPPSK